MPTRSDRLAFRELGAGDPVILVNGYAATKDDWDPAFVQELSRGGRVVCPDNRGMGESPPLAGELTVSTMAGDVIDLMDALGIERGHLIGWSMGGFIAQEVAAAVPGRVNRLALLSTDHGGPGAVTADPQTWARLTDHGGTPREQATRMLALLFPPEVARAIDAEFGDLVAQARAALSPAALDAQERAIDRWHDAPADGRLAAITAPALIACGAKDVVIPAANTELLAEALPGSRREIFAGGGHAFMAQEPVRLAATIHAWLAR